MEQEKVTVFSIHEVSEDILQQISFKQIFDYMQENKDIFNGIVAASLLHKKYLTAFQDLGFGTPSAEISEQQKQFRANHYDVGMKLIYAQGEYEQALTTKNEDLRQQSLKKLEELLQPFFVDQPEISGSQTVKFLLG